MREGWKTATLGNVLDIQNGYAFDSKKFADDGDMPLIRIRDLKTGTTTATRYSGEYDAKYVVRAGDLLIGMDGEFACYEWKGGPALLNQRVCRLQEFSASLLPRFLFYGINKFLKDIEDVTTFTTVKHLSGRQIKAIEFPLPPLPEQKRIVAILDEAFAGIATAVANTEMNLANARDLFESYLHAVIDAAFSNGEIAVLADLASEITDGDHMPPPKAPSGIPFVTIKNIDKKTRRIDFEDTFSVPLEYFERLKENKRPQEGDVLYTVTGSFGIPVLVEQKTEFCFQRHIGLIRPKSDTNSRWLYYLLLSPQLFAQAIERATGTAQKTVSLKALRGFKVPVIQWNRQLTAVQGLDQLYYEAKRLESIYRQKLSALAELKQSLLQKAFSGELTAASQNEIETALA